MNCQDFHHLLQRRLDGAAPGPASGYEEHLRSCRACATLDGAARRLAEGLRLMPPPAPPPDLAERIVARALRLRRRRRGRRVVVPLALAACLLVAITARLYWGQRHRATPSPATEPTQIARPQEESPDRGGLRDSVAEAGQAVASLTSRTASSALSSARWMLPEVSPPQVLPQPLEPPARTLRQAGEGVRAGLEPVTGSARRAVGLFLRELPMDLGEGQGW
jgi:hypothetical protein